MAVKRPWIEPDAVKAYTDHKEVAERSDDRMQTDIFRAEQKVIAITHNKFDNEELSEIPEPVRIAVIIIAEAYAKNSIESAKKQIRSETFDEYSYSMESGMIDIDGLDLDYLLKDYMQDDRNGNVIFRATIL